MGLRPRNLGVVKGVPMDLRPTQGDENLWVFDRAVRRLSAAIRQADTPFFWLQLVNWKRAPPGETPIVKSANDRDAVVSLEAQVAGSKPIRGGSLGGADGSSISTSNIAKQRRQVNR